MYCVNSSIDSVVCALAFRHSGALPSTERAMLDSQQTCADTLHRKWEGALMVPQYMSNKATVSLQFKGGHAELRGRSACHSYPNIQDASHFSEDGSVPVHEGK